MIWGLLFVVIEALQFVYFGGIFQNVSSFLFGFLVFGIIAVLFIGGSVLKAPDQLRLAFRNRGNLIGLNVVATLAWASYLTSVELIEPAVVYTISAGVMPITTLIAQRTGFSESGGVRDRTEWLGMLLLLVGIIYLSAITVSGYSGFVQGDSTSAVIGVSLAIADGVFFTCMLIFCERIGLAGVGPSVIFGLRFPLYVVVAGGMSIYGFEAKPALPSFELLTIIVLGLILTVPHLYALQKAVATIPTAVISVLTTIGPFVIFVLQMIEGRVDYSGATLIGLFIYFVGSLLSVVSLFRKTRTSS